jgi:hypothetical protein
LNQASNLSDFPPDMLTLHGIEARHPDHLFTELLDSDADAFCAAVRLQRQGLKNPPMSVEALLVKLEGAGRLRAFDNTRIASDGPPHRRASMAWGDRDPATGHGRPPLPTDWGGPGSSDRFDGQACPDSRLSGLLIACLSRRTIHKMRKIFMKSLQSNHNEINIKVDSALLHKAIPAR